MVPGDTSDGLRRFFSFFPPGTSAVWAVLNTIHLASHKAAVWQIANNSLKKNKKKLNNRKGGLKIFNATRS